MVEGYKIMIQHSQSLWMANDNETFPTILKQPNTITTLVIVCKKFISSHHAHYKQGMTSRSRTEEFSS